MPVLAAGLHKQFCERRRTHTRTKVEQQAIAFKQSGIVIGKIKGKGIALAGSRDIVNEVPCGGMVNALRTDKIEGALVCFEGYIKLRKLLSPEFRLQQGKKHQEKKAPSGKKKRRKNSRLF